MIRQQMTRFVLVGVTAVALAYVIYRGLLLVGVNVNIANAIAYIAATALSFFANRTWTFLNNATISDTIGKFVALHVCSLIANVLVNSVVLSWLIDQPFSVGLAFLTAIAVSTAINFTGMKFLVFSEHEFS